MSCLECRCGTVETDEALKDDHHAIEQHTDQSHNKHHDKHLSKRFGRSVVEHVPYEFAQARDWKREAPRRLAPSTPHSKRNPQSGEDQRQSRRDNDFEQTISRSPASSTRATLR